MFLTDLSIKRPVVASVMSLVLVIFGLVTFQEIPTDELPDVQPPVVTIQTEYRGASAEIVDTQITQKIEDEITKAETWRQPGEHSSGPLSCFDSEHNRERRKRADKLAKELIVTTQNIAGAWPLNLSFPSFALIGPRKVEEIDTSLPSLDITISKEKLDWLNLNN